MTKKSDAAPTSTDQAKIDRIANDQWAIAEMLAAKDMTIAHMLLALGIDMTETKRGTPTVKIVNLGVDLALIERLKMAVQRKPDGTSAAAE